MYVCMYVCMYACMYVCMYACMYVCMCIYIYIRVCVIVVYMCIHMYIYVHIFIYSSTMYLPNTVIMIPDADTLHTFCLCTVDPWGLGVCTYVYIHIYIYMLLTYMYIYIYTEREREREREKERMEETTKERKNERKTQENKELQKERYRHRGSLLGVQSRAPLARPRRLRPPAGLRREGPRAGGEPGPPVIGLIRLMIEIYPKHMKTGWDHSGTILGQFWDKPRPKRLMYSLGGDPLYIHIYIYTHTSIYIYMCVIPTYCPYQEILQMARIRVFPTLRL